MSISRLLLCIVCPPLAVFNKGCAVIALVTVAWVLGWVPGIFLSIALGGASKD